MTYEAKDLDQLVSQEDPLTLYRVSFDNGYFLQGNFGQANYGQPGYGTGNWMASLVTDFLNATKSAFFTSGSYPAAIPANEVTIDNIRKIEQKFASKFVLENGTTEIKKSKVWFSKAKFEMEFLSLIYQCKTAMLQSSADQKVKEVFLEFLNRFHALRYLPVAVDAMNIDTIEKQMMGTKLICKKYGIAESNHKKLQEYQKGIRYPLSVYPWLVVFTADRNSGPMPAAVEAVTNTAGDREIVIDEHGIYTKGNPTFAVRSKTKEALVMAMLANKFKATEIINLENEFKELEAIVSDVIKFV